MEEKSGRSALLAHRVTPGASFKKLQKNFVPGISPVNIPFT
jgi:hypothetical protein